MSEIQETSIDYTHAEAEIHRLTKGVVAYMK